MGTDVGPLENAWHDLAVIPDNVLPAYRPFTGAAERRGRGPPRFRHGVILHIEGRKETTGKGYPAFSAGAVRLKPPCLMNCVALWPGTGALKKYPWA